MALTEQANAYSKHRGAGDRAGDLAWGARVGTKALRVSVEAAAQDIEGLFELTADEKLVWRLLRLARKYTDLEKCGFLAADEMRAVLRGFVAADVVDVVHGDEAKALIPAEVKRLKAQLEGKEWHPTIGTLHGKVYRPDIDEITAEGAPVMQSSSERTPVPSDSGSDQVIRDSPYVTLRDQLRAAAKNAPRVNHYVFLSVASTAIDAVIHNAYVNLAREYHPDRLSGTPLEHDAASRGFVDTLFKRLGEANKILGNPESRSRYDRELIALAKGTGVAPGEAAPSHLRRPVEGRQAYTMGESWFKKKDFKLAEMHYRQAARFDPEEPLILVALAWCIYLNPETPDAVRYVDAKRRLQDILKRYKTADAAYKLARVLKDSGDEDGSFQLFAEALAYNPEHVESQREFRIASARRQKIEEDRKKVEESSKSIFRKIFHF